MTQVISQEPGDLSPASLKAPAARNRALRNHLVAFAVCLALGFVFTLPGSLFLGSGLLGYPGDNFQHAWFLWQFAHAILHAHNPFYTHLIFYPERVNLAWSTADPLAGLMALPLSLAAGPVVAYNFSIILQLALAAFCARLLCLRVSRNEAAALIGGVVFGFSPYLMAHALAHLSLVTAFPIPLFVLALDRIFSERNPSWWSGVLLGFALLLAALAHYNYVVLCLLFALVWLVIQCFQDWGTNAFGFLNRIWKPLSAGAATFIVGFSPLLWMMVAQRSDVPPSRGLSHIETYSAGTLGFLIPSWNHVFFGRFVRHMNPKIFAAGLEGTVYAGIVVLALAAFGFWKSRNSNRRWAFGMLLVSIIFYLLSLGPTIHVLGRDLSLTWPAALFYRLPFAGFMSAPARFDAIVALCLGILCSLGVKVLLDQPANRNRRYWIVPLIGILVIADYLTVPFPRSSTVNPGELYAGEAAHQIAAQSCSLPPDLRPGTILTFPLVKEPYCLKSLWMQVSNGGRYALVDGYLSYTPPSIWSQFWDVRILRSLMSFEGANRAPIEVATDASSAAATIRELDLSAVVIFDSPNRDAAARYVEQVFGATPERSGSCTVFRLGLPPKNARIESAAGGH